MNIFLSDEVIALALDLYFCLILAHVLIYGFVSAKIDIYDGAKLGAAFGIALGCIYLTMIYLPGNNQYFQRFFVCLVISIAYFAFSVRFVNKQKIITSNRTWLAQKGQPCTVWLFSFLLKRCA